MKTLILAISLLFLIGCNQNNKTEKKDERSTSLSDTDNITPFNTKYFPSTSDFAKFQKYIPKDIRSEISKNLSDTSFEFIAQLYESTGIFTTPLSNLVTIRFNRRDSIISYRYLETAITVNGKATSPNKSEKLLFTSKKLNLFDTIFNRINISDFWNQPSEIKIDADDGVLYCVLIKYKNKFHYLSRISPEIIKRYPKRVEFMRLCDLFKDMGKNEYKNSWNWDS